MKIESMFVTVPKGSKPPPLPADQLEFVVDRGARKVRGLVGGLLGIGEPMRVQTDRPFEIDVDLALRDTTLSSMRVVDCRARIQGQIDRDDEAVRQFLRLCLEADFRIQDLASRLLEASLAKYATGIGGAFVRHMRTNNGHELMQKALVDEFRSAGFPARRITVAPVLRDVRPHLNLDHADKPLGVRSRGTLESHRVGFKVRLTWGTADEQVVARLTYAGSIEGRVPGAALRNPAVAGQTQPLEHWFRELLTDALSREEWNAVVASEEAMIRRVGEGVSTALGAGTGRVIDTLVLFPVMQGGTESAESTAKFSTRYAITGVKGEGIEVEHAIRFTLVDPDRWQAQGSPDPQAFIKAQVVEAAKSFLIDKRFEDIVGLFMLGAQGERTFRDGIGSRVGLSVRSIGYRLDSVATILAIPEMDFMHGRVLRLPERSYGLADPHVEPVLHIEARVRVRQDDNGALFARALAMFGEFEERVCADIEETVRGRLREVSALSYYSSPFVNGVRTVQDPDTGDWRSLASADSRLQTETQTAVDASLGRKFGLEIVNFWLVPGEDRLIRRMRELGSLSETYRFEMAFARGDEETTVRLRAQATLFIGSIAPDHWSSFHHNAYRMTLEQHHEKIRATLEDTLRLLEGIVVNTPVGALGGLDVKQEIVQLFTRRMSEEQGLVVRLYPLQLTVERPGAGQISAMEIAALKEELQAQLNRRRDLVEEDAGYGGQTRAQLTQRIEEIKRELAAAATAQNAVLQLTHTVRIEQDPRSGRLIENGGGKPPGEGSAEVQPPW